MRLNLGYQLSDLCKEDLNALDSERYAVRRLIPGGLEEYFARGARIFSTQGSTAIEGNKVRPQTSAEIVEGLTEPRGEQQLEVYNLAQAYDLTYQLTNDRSMQIDGGTIRALNSVLQKGSTQPGAASRGSYRRPGGPDVAIRADRGRGAVLYQPPRSDHVPALMGGLVEDIQSWREEEPGPIAAALTHFGLVSIHPFEDGNGRTARLLADMVLDLTDWSVDRMLSVSSVIHASGDDYFDALRETQGPVFVDTVDATPFVEYHTRQLRRAVDQLQQAVVWLLQMADEIAADFESDRETSLLAWYLATIGPISSSAFASLIGVSQSTAVQRLGQLARNGFIRRVGAGRSTRYTLPSRT